MTDGYCTQNDMDVEGTNYMFAFGEKIYTGPDFLCSCYQPKDSVEPSTDHMHHD